MSLPEDIIPSQEELNKILGKQPNLSLQSYDTLKTDISPSTFEIMSRQATMNIGIKYKNIKNLITTKNHKKILYINYHRYNWSCGSWKNHLGTCYIRSTDNKT